MCIVAEHAMLHWGMFSTICCAAADAEEDIDGGARVTDGRDTGLRQRRDQQRQPKQQQQQQQQQAQQLLVMPAGAAWVYSLNGVSAALTKESPVSVANLVKMNQDHAAAYPFLSEVRAFKRLATCWHDVSKLLWLQHCCCCCCSGCRAAACNKPNTAMLSSSTVAVYATVVEQIVTASGCCWKKLPPQCFTSALD
jgi:hypothetical protein